MTRNQKKKPSATKTGKPVGVRKGRFRSEMDPLFARFNASIAVDHRLFEHDIRGSIAHARMLARQEIISRDDARKLETGLRSVLERIRRGEIRFREELEDVHVNIEEALRQEIGEVAGKLHTARSRNDQIALDLRMYLLDEVERLQQYLRELMAALVDTAEQNMELVMPGYTHLQRGQPVRLAHHLMAYFEMFRRDWQRLSDSVSRIDRMPLGSAALAGTTFPVDREWVARELGFSSVAANSMDAVSDRDFAVEFAFDCAMMMMHLSRLAEELILWASQEFGFCSLPDDFCSGSSIMPQKKNPDACELIRAKTGRVYGDLMALLTVLKALPLTYNKDLQEDKEPVFDCLDTVSMSIRIMAGLISGARFHGEKMLEAASDPTLAATDLADSYVRQGKPFREAHAAVGAIMRGRSERSGYGRMKGVSLSAPEEMVEARKHIGGTARARVKEQIRDARGFLKKSGEKSARSRSGR